MKESDAITKWVQEYLTKYPRAFVHKIADMTRCALGHPTGCSKKPFDVIAYSAELGPQYYEFKVATSGNPAAALNKMEPHQIDALTRIAKLGGDERRFQAACIVFLPRDKHDKETGPYVPFHEFHAGKDCNGCGFTAAPHHGVCKKCPWSKDGEPNYFGA